MNKIKTGKQYYILVDESGTLPDLKYVLGLDRVPGFVIIKIVNPTAFRAARL